MQFKIFYNLLTAPQTVSNTYARPGRNHLQIMCNTSSAYKYIMSYYMSRGRKGQLSYEVWQGLNHIHLSFILLVEPLTNEGGEETGAPGENPWWRASVVLHAAHRHDASVRALLPQGHQGCADTDGITTHHWTDFSWDHYTPLNWFLMGSLHTTELISHGITTHHWTDFSWDHYTPLNWFLMGSLHTIELISHGIITHHWTDFSWDHYTPLN